MSLITLFIAGLTDSYNPCSIGVLLVSLTILMSLGKKNSIALFGISYLTTIFLTYFLIGLGFLKAFHLFGVHGFFGYAAGAVLIIVGLAHFAPISWSKIPIVGWFNRCYMPQIKAHFDRGVFVGGIILGFLIGLCTVPCAGGIYLGAIGLLAARVSFWQGFLGIFIFNLGFILPLSLIFFISSREKVLKKIQKINAKLSGVSHYIIPIITVIMGIILILIGKM